MSAPALTRAAGWVTRWRTVTDGIVQTALIVGGHGSWSNGTFVWPLVLAAIECMFAVTGYAILGPYLGLRQPSAHPAHQDVRQQPAG